MKRRDQSAARNRQKILTAISPYLSQLYPAREAIALLTTELMAGRTTSHDMTASVVRIEELVAGVRRGFEEAVLTLPDELQVTSNVSDVRRAIAQVEGQVANLAEQVTRAKRR